MLVVNTLNELGLRNIELSDFSLLKRLQPILKGAGFHVLSSFFPSPYITGNWNPVASLGLPIPQERNFESVIKHAVKYNLEYLVMPGLFPEDRGGLDVYLKLAEKLNLQGEKCKKEGIQLCYHHYSYELQPMGNTNPLQVMIDNLEDSLVKLQPDTFWLSIAGVNIAEYFNQYAAYVGPIHLADKSANAPSSYRAISLPPGSSQALGMGTIDFKSFFSLKEMKGVPYFFLHMEDIANPLEAVENSITYLKNL